MDVVYDNCDGVLVLSSFEILFISNCVNMGVEYLVQSIRFSYGSLKI